MIVYPLSKTETRIVRWLIPGACVLLALTLCIICDLADWFEGLIPLTWFGMDA